MSRLEVEEQLVEREAVSVGNAVRGFGAKSLDVAQSRSTITAAGSLQAAFRLAQDNTVRLAEGVRNGAGNIRKLNAAFRQFDRDMQQFNRNRERK